MIWIACVFQDDVFNQSQQFHDNITESQQFDDVNDPNNLNDTVPQPKDANHIQPQLKPLNSKADDAHETTHNTPVNQQQQFETTQDIQQKLRLK